jgi:hypothetical protein
MSPTKEEIELAQEACKDYMDAVNKITIIENAYLEAVEALREAVVEEETMLDDHGFLDPEHGVELRHQVKRHNAILEKAPEEEGDD